MEAPFEDLLETDPLDSNSIKPAEATGTTRHERDSPVGICTARLSFRCSDVSRRPTVHRISIKERYVYTGRRKDRRNAALRSLRSRFMRFPTHQWFSPNLVARRLQSLGGGQLKLGAANRSGSHFRFLKFSGDAANRNDGLAPPHP